VKRTLMGRSGAVGLTEAVGEAVGGGDAESVAEADVDDV
jgi:hypothetical protein